MLHRQLRDRKCRLDSVASHGSRQRHHRDTMQSVSQLFMFVTKFGRVSFLYFICHASLSCYSLCHSANIYCVTFTGSHKQINQSPSNNLFFFFFCVVRSSEMLCGSSFFYKSLCQVASKLITRSARMSALSQACFFPNISSETAGNIEKVNSKHHFEGRFQVD